MTNEERTVQFAEFVRDGERRGISRREFLRRGLAMGLSLPAILNVLTACGVEPMTGASAPQAPTQSIPIIPSTPTTVSTPTVVPPSATPVPTETSIPTPTAPPTATTIPTPTPAPAIRFGVIGDFGQAGEAAESVAALVKSWNPAFIVTTGDNNYPSGSAETIDANIGQYYHEYIGNYNGQYGPGSPTHRFFPCLGNHDWEGANAQPYFDYFTLPNNERYYTFTQGPIQFFALDSMPGEPDGITSDSAQGLWLQQKLAASGACWKVVFFHHSPHSSGLHGSMKWMRWPFKEWGADVVLSGHDHNYERLIIDGFPYFINGLGGGARYDLRNPQEGSQIFFNKTHGAQLVEVNGGSITLTFVTRDGDVVDTHTLTKGCG
jgi:hypothetical protein